MWWVGLGRGGKRDCRRGLRGWAGRGGYEFVPIRHGYWHWHFFERFSYFCSNYPNGAIHS